MDNTKISQLIDQVSQMKPDIQAENDEKSDETTLPVVFQNLPMGISMELISRVCSYVPDDLSRYTNCCWANGVLFLLFACQETLNDEETVILADAIRSQNNNASGPITLFHILKNKSLQLTLVQYCVEDNSKFTVGNDGTSGETLVMILEGGHFQLGAYSNSIVPSKCDIMSKDLFDDQIAFEYQKMMSSMSRDFMMACDLSQENQNDLSPCSSSFDTQVYLCD
jgi:hypothetical protein